MSTEKEHMHYHFKGSYESMLLEVSIMTRLMSESNYNNPYLIKTELPVKNLEKVIQRQCICE